MAGIVDPSYPGVPEMLHAAAAGDRAALDRFVEAVHRGSAATAQDLSQGLHASTLCADLDWPWLHPGAPPAQRRSALTLAAARISPSALYPFDRSSAVNNGVATTCVHWPEASRHHLTGQLPRVPTLLLGGDRDLSTPVEWLREQATRTPTPTVVIVPGAGHSVQNRATDDAGRQAVYRFLLR